MLSVCLLGVRNEKVGVSTEVRRGVSLPRDRGRFMTTPNALTNKTALTLDGLVRLPSTGIFYSDNRNAVFGETPLGTSVWRYWQ